MFKGLQALILERFSPVQYGPMIAIFTIANGLYFSGPSFSSFGMAASFIILSSAFFRLRLFDEIKDYETDLKINPTRPLARGVLTVTQVKITLLILICFELIMSAAISPSLILIHTLAIFYSLMMFEEFFVGKFIRLHLTTYAVIHTFCSVLMGITAAFGSQLNRVAQFTYVDLLFFLSNWAFFNIFEFARKTYATSEERIGVDTYSSLFGVKGAVSLSLSQVFLGLLFLRISLSSLNLLPVFFLAGLYLIPCLVFAFKPTPKSAKLFRNLSGLYLLLHYVALAWVLGKGSL